MKEGNWVAWHGTKGNKNWALPRLAAASDKANRSDQGNTIKANEYLDDPAVLEAKIDIVVQLIRASKYCCAYTGAGLSKASGIPDYASKAQNSVVKAPKITSNLDALPTYAHFVLAALERAGYLKHYVQQNHDGLPQKAGYPQEKLNEIHGAWFDPSNPVVQFSGSLRGDLFTWMMEAEEEVDLCLCLGTSLSGMNADRMASTPAKKSLKKNAKVLGTVIINIQQTRLDSQTAIRVWAKLDDAFKMLTERLKLEIIPNPIKVPPGDVYVVHYDKNGKYDKQCDMIWDLKKGAQVFVPIEEAMNGGAKGSIVGKRDEHYSVELNEKNGPVRRLFGNWWIDAALKGAVPQLPIINVNPKITKKEDKENKNKKEIEEEEEEEEEEEIVIPKNVKVIQGHFCVDDEKSGRNKHSWNLKLEDGAHKFVDHVTWILHPTFKDPKVRCSEPPYEIRRIGWGTFIVEVKIVLKNGKRLEAKHSLTFKQEGNSVRETIVPINS